MKPDVETVFSLRREEVGKLWEEWALEDARSRAYTAGYFDAWYDKFAVDRDTPDPDGISHQDSDYLMGVEDGKADKTSFNSNN